MKLSASFDRGQTFSYATTVTDQPWDPAVDAPYSHGAPQGNKNVVKATFIGEYFGLDAHEGGFNVLWTDTRTGVQELFYARVDTERIKPPDILVGISAQVLFGLLAGGGGAILVNGHIVPVPPPDHDLAQAMVALNAASKIGGPSGRWKVRLCKPGASARGALAACAAIPAIDEERTAHAMVAHRIRRLLASAIMIAPQFETD